MRKLDEFCEKVLEKIEMENEELFDILNDPDFSIDDLNINEDDITNAFFYLVFSFNNSKININNNYKDYLNKIDKNTLKERLLFFTAIDDNLNKSEKKERIYEISNNKLSKKILIDKLINNYEIFVPQILDNLTSIIYYALPYLLENMDENGYCKFDINENLVEYSPAINQLTNSLLMFANKEDNYIEIHMPKEILNIVKDKVNSDMTPIIDNNDMLFNTIIKLTNVYGLFRISDLPQLTSNFNNYSTDKILEKIIAFSIYAPLFKVERFDDETLILANEIDTERDELFINDLLCSKLSYKIYSDEDLEQYIDNTYITNLKEYKKVVKKIKSGIDDEDFVVYITENIIPTFIAYYLIDEDLAYDYLDDEDLEDLYEDLEKLAIKCPSWKLKGDLLK